MGCGRQPLGCCTGSASTGSVGAGWRGVLIDTFDAIAGRAVVNRLPSMLRPLFLRRLVIGEGTAQLPVAAKRRCGAGILVLGANHTTPDSQERGSPLDTLPLQPLAPAPARAPESELRSGHPNTGTEIRTAHICH